MDNPQRATVAVLCSYIQNNQRKGSLSIYDYARQRHLQFMVMNNGNDVAVHDYERGCDMTGRFPSYYDYGVSRYITLTKEGTNVYNVFDYNRRSYLMVAINGSFVTIFDYEKSQYYNYSIN